ncbi:unnamed protein product [Paramecium octaurelia]|uniref:Uncharacterized protein n=1 Tax=Paramecium octaurelia TaxID=43137 RepID=A0A8S1YK74_PAROT|nr:unnamed protein product [Paramecium octaurelia]CAD8215237.1 unnamed protein product [Paramecium octaurelia]
MTTFKNTANTTQNTTQNLAKSSPKKLNFSILQYADGLQSCSLSNKAQNVVRNQKDHQCWCDKESQVIEQKIQFFSILSNLNIQSLSNDKKSIKLKIKINSCYLFDFEYTFFIRHKPFLFLEFSSFLLNFYYLTILHLREVMLIPYKVPLEGENDVPNLHRRQSHFIIFTQCYDQKIFVYFRNVYINNSPPWVVQVC